ncbi:MAG: hypothetical protein QM757_35830 [Paludibaculum sp.]
MSTSLNLPTKEVVAREIGLVAGTLTDEMQTAALHKARELGFDLARGRLSLEETLINLSTSRDVLRDAAEKGKLEHLPLKVQYTLYKETAKVAETLGTLVNGSDAVQALEDVVEDLTASTWQYNLRNLSEQVLGFEQKMNQLKSQEIVIREAHRAAQGFEGVKLRAQTLIEELESLFSKSKERSDTMIGILEESSVAVTKATENELLIASYARQAQEYSGTASRNADTAGIAAGKAQVIADQLSETQSAIDAARAMFEGLNTKSMDVISSFEQSAKETSERFQAEYEQLKNTEAEKSEVLRDAVTRNSEELKVASEELRSDTQQRLLAAQEEHSRILEDLSGGFSRTSREAVEALRVNGEAALNRQQEAADRQRETAQVELNRLVKELDMLEGQIRESIRRATGFTLFHSFQKRQEDLEISKRFWVKMLSTAIGAAILLSVWFIYYASAIQNFGPAFYLKLTISLPLVYAIWFCSVQYSRERRLEEEYAFKSSISISLDPYRELVDKLVLRDKPEELAKYTAFVIESVSRVFTSPTEIAFERAKDPTPAEDILKAAGEFANVLLKAAKK